MPAPASNSVLSDQKLRLLAEFGLTVDEVARGCGVTANAVYARRGTKPRRRTAFDEALDDLFFIANQLRDFGLDDEMIRAWLCSRSAHLDALVPLDAIARGEFDEVRAAADAYLNGIPASEFRDPRIQPDNRGADRTAVVHQLRAS